MKWKIVILASAIACLPGTSNAQYLIPKSVIAAGGGISTGPSFHLYSTIGQSLIGETVNSAYDLFLGYGYTGRGIVTGIGLQPEETLPTEYRLEQNYPNPFNPSTTITFVLPEKGWVHLKIFNIRGREVVTLVNRQFAPGRYRIVWDATGKASGIYFYRIHVNGFTAMKKMLLEK